MIFKRDPLASLLDIIEGPAPADLRGFCRATLGSLPWVSDVRLVPAMQRSPPDRGL